MNEQKDQYEIKVYKIWYADAPDDIYVGSTKLSLSRRMVEHRSVAKRGKTSLIYTTMRAKGINNFEYCMLGSCMVSNMDEQRMFEQSYIATLNPKLNMCRAYITEDERKQQVKENNERLENKLKKSEYSRKPETRQKIREYEQRLENKQKKHEYNQKPEQKQRIRAYNQTPMKKQYNKVYQTLVLKVNSIREKEL